MSDIRLMQDRRDELIAEAKSNVGDPCPETSQALLWMANKAVILEEKLKVARKRNSELMELVAVEGKS